MVVFVPPSSSLLSIPCPQHHTPQTRTQTLSSYHDVRKRWSVPFGRPLQRPALPAHAPRHPRGAGPTAASRRAARAAALGRALQRAPPHSRQAAELRRAVGAPRALPLRRCELPIRRGVQVCALRRLRHRVGAPRRHRHTGKRSRPADAPPAASRRGDSTVCRVSPRSVLLSRLERSSKQGGCRGSLSHVR